MKRLYKSEENRIIAGVIGGLGEYYDIDPTILRLAYIIITISTGVFPGILGYVIAMMIVPRRNQIHHVYHTEKHEHKEHKPEEPKKESEEKKEEPKENVI